MLLLCFSSCISHRVPYAINVDFYVCYEPITVICKLLMEVSEWLPEELANALKLAKDGHSVNMLMVKE